jgi:hypothetical protein
LLSVRGGFAAGLKFRETLGRFLASKPNQRTPVWPNDCGADDSGLGPECSQGFQRGGGIAPFQRGRHMACHDGSERAEVLGESGSKDHHLQDEDRACESRECDQTRLQDHQPHFARSGSATPRAVHR